MDYFGMLYVVVIVLVALKCYEMSFHIIRYSSLDTPGLMRLEHALCHWTAEDPPTEVRGLIQEYLWTCARSTWPITGPVLRFAYAQKVLALRKALAILALNVFRWPVLMLSLAIMLVVVRERPWLSALALTFLLSGIWTELALRFACRTTIGPLESFLRRNVRHEVVLEDCQLDLYITRPGPLDLVRDFLYSYIRLCVVVVVGYASIYAYLASTGRPAEIDGIRHGQGLLAGVLTYPVQFCDGLYFSMVTTATVGYGDVAPKSIYARALVGSQIASSFTLLVLLLTAVCLTPRSCHPTGMEPDCPVCRPPAVASQASVAPPDTPNTGSSDSD